MEKKFVNMLADFKEFKKGESYEIDSKTATAWIDAGLAEETEAPTKDLVNELTKAFEEKLAERDAQLLKSIAKVESKTPSIRVIEDEAEKTKSLGEMIQLVVKAQRGDDSEKVEAKKKLDGVYKSTLQVGSGVLGGYTVPTQFVNQLIRNETIPSAFLDRTTKVPVTGEGEVELPALDQSITPNGTGQLADNAGVKVYHSTELDDANETDFNFKMVKLKPERMTAFIPLTNHLLRSSALGVQALANSLLVEAMNSQREYDCLLADGVAKALGATLSSAAIAHSRTTASRIKWADVTGMFSKMHPARRGKGIWLYGVGTEVDIFTLQDDNGNFVFQPAAQNGPDMKLLGRPMFPCEFLPALGTAKDLLFVDPSAYYTIEGLQPTISVSEHVRWLKDQTLIKVECWFNGQSAFNYKTTLGNGTTQVSPFVYLN